MLSNLVRKSFFSTQSILKFTSSSINQSAAAGGSEKAKRTALYDFHKNQGGKMVEFAGWEMPVQYTDQSLVASHLHTRNQASLFDVSHMLQTRWSGKDRHKFIEYLTVGDIAGLPIGGSTLSVFTNAKGGIIDDTVINQQDEKALYVVSNAGCAEKDLKHIRQHLREWQQKGFDVQVDILDHLSLVALQGPKAASVLEKLSGGKSLNQFKFMSGQKLKVSGLDCYVSRSGYTGEDGFEIAVPHDKIVSLCEQLLEDSQVKLAGLGARDSLRLEAGLCLYGHDLNDTTSPVEAGLTWTIGKRRRTEGGFLGAETILKHLKDGVARRRIGLVGESGAPARENAEIYAKEGNELVLVGKVTSGCPSPSLKKNIAMGYVKSGYHKSGTQLEIKVRNKMQSSTVTKMPFVPSRYHRVA